MKTSGSTTLFDAAVHARLVLEVAHRHGADTEEILADVGVAREAIEEPLGSVPVAVLAALMREAMRRTGDEQLGYHMGGGAMLPLLGLPGHTVKASAVMREAVCESAALLRLISNTVELSPQFEDNPARVVYSINSDDDLLNRQLSEFHAALFASNTRKYVHPGFSPERVSFRHERPRGHAELRRFFRCPVHFAQAVNAIAFDAAWLERPLITADEELRSALAPHVAAILESLKGEHRWRDHVRSTLAELLGRKQPSLAAVSRHLGVKPRTLQHKLRQSGTSFAEIRDELREHIALEKLRATRSPISEIAYFLGFRDVGAFDRAFRRWTGTTPQAYR